MNRRYLSIAIRVATWCTLAAALLYVRYMPTRRFDEWQSAFAQHPGHVGGLTLWIVFAMGMTIGALSAALRAARMRRWVRLGAFFCASIFIGASSAFAAIPLSGFLQNQGTFAPLGQSDVAMPNSAYTLSASEYAPRAIRFTGTLTADQNATVPLEKGITYELTNATSGGFNILFGGSTGARATIPASTTAPLVVHCPDGANFYVMSGGGSSFTPGGDLDGSATAQYVVGIQGDPVDPATCRSPSGSSRMYWDGTKWTCAVPSLSGDLSGTASSNTFPGAVLSATGAAGNPYDAGGNFFVNKASGECIAGIDGGFCAQDAPTVFSDATTWQTIFSRQMVVNQPADWHLIFDAWDYSADGGSITKNFVEVALEVHIATDSSGTPFLIPQSGADFSPGPVTLYPLKPAGVSGCTTNNTDAGCAPSLGAATSWSFRAINLGSAVVAVQAQATPTTRWPWKGNAMLNEQRNSP